MKIEIKRTITETYVLENPSSQDLISAATEASYGKHAMPGDGELHEDWVERILADSGTLAVLCSHHGSADDTDEEFEIVDVTYND